MKEKTTNKRKRRFKKVKKNKTNNKMNIEPNRVRNSENISNKSCDKALNKIFCSSIHQKDKTGDVIYVKEPK